jgi:hypothetical protein
MLLAALPTSLDMHAGTEVIVIMRTLFVAGLLALIVDPAIASSPAVSNRTTFRLEQGLITVPVEVAGHTLPLMLDLGDFRAISLTSAVLDTVAVDFTGEVDHFTNFAGEPLAARRFRVQDVALGGVRHAILVGSEDVHDPTNPSPNPYGAIGRGFLEGRTLAIDYAAGILQVPAVPLGPDAGLPLDLSGGMLRLAAVVDGRELTFLVDTGAMVSVVDPAHFAETTLAYGEHSAYEAESVRLGERDHGALVLLRVELGAPEFDGILGSDFLARYRVRIDLQAGRLALDEV